MSDEKKKRRGSKRLFVVVTERDGLLEKHYSGPDKAAASTAVERQLQRDWEAPSGRRYTVVLKRVRTSASFATRPGVGVVDVEAGTSRIG